MLASTTDSLCKSSPWLTDAQNQVILGETQPVRTCHLLNLQPIAAVLLLTPRQPRPSGPALQLLPRIGSVPFLGKRFCRLPTTRHRRAWQWQFQRRSSHTPRPALKSSHILDAAPVDPRCHSVCSSTTRTAPDSVLEAHICQTIHFLALRLTTLAVAIPELPRQPRRQEKHGAQDSEVRDQVSPRLHQPLTSSAWLTPFLQDPQGHPRLCVFPFLPPASRLKPNI
jgi:hypothetical protein